MHLLAIDDLVLADYNVHATLITDQSEQLQFSARWRDGAASPVFLKAASEPALWDIIVQCDDLATRSAILDALTSDPTQQRRLLAQRLDARKTWVAIEAAVRTITPLTETDLGIEFEGSDSVWTAVAVEETSKTFTSTLDRAMHVSVPGNTRAAPIITLAPVAQRTAPSIYAGWRYRRRYTIENASDVPWFRQAVRVSLGSTTALVSGGKAQADGDDVRVWLDGIEQPRTLVTWNTAASYLWFIIPALPAGETMTIDVVYGNSAATNPPSLAYPDLPAFDLALSSNALLEWPINRVAGNAGRGLWALSQTAEPATPDYSVPGAWRPVSTLENPDNPDTRYVKPYFDVAVGTNTWAILDSWRSAREYVPASVEYFQNGYDGVAFYSPLPVQSITADWAFLNVNGTTLQVYLARDSSAEDWLQWYGNNTTYNTITIVTPGTQTLARAVRHVAVALWPREGWDIPDADSSHYAQLFNNTFFRVAIDTSDLIITWVGSLEEEIYELAASVQVGGGEERVAPYTALLLGNARQETGSGTPRLAVTLDQELVIDTEAHTHEVWADDALVEGASAHAVSGVIAWDDDGVAAEAGTAAWVPLTPTRQRVPNGSFDVDVGNWEAGDTTTGMTTARSWDGATVVGEQLGALRMAVGPNTGGLAAIARTLNGKRFPVNGRETVEIAATVRTDNANLAPGLYVAFYDVDEVAIGEVHEAVWTPVANTPLRRAHSAAVPGNAATYRLGVIAYARAANPTGNVWFDDVTVNDSEVLLIDEAMGQLALTVGLRGKWVG